MFLSVKVHNGLTSQHENISRYLVR